MKFDDVLGEIGSFGRYQARVYVMSSMVAVLSALQLFALVFLVTDINHRCAIPSLPNDTYEVQNEYHERLINLSVPMVTKAYGETGYSKCKLYAISTTTADHVVEHENKTEYKCDSWVYDNTSVHSSLVSEFDLVCDAEIYHSHSIMVAMAGGAVGAFAIGPLSDLMGRKKSLILTVIACVLPGVINAFSVSYAMFVTSSFFFNVGSSSMFSVAFVIGVEIVGPAKRTFAGMVINIFFGAGEFLLTLAAYFFRDWRTLRLVLVCPLVVLLSYWWLIPESPRWLMSVGRKEEAAQVIRKIAKSNKTTFNEAVLSKVTADDPSTGRFKDMLTNRILLYRTVAICFNWFATMASYTGLTLNVQNLSGNIYLNFFLTSLVEVVAYIFAYILLSKVGRKPLLIWSLVICGLPCLAAIFPVLYGSSSSDWTLNLLSLVAKFGSASCFAVAYMYSTELFPTIVRQSAIGVASFCSNVGGMVAPYLSDLAILVHADLAPALPLLIFGVLTIISAVLLIPLPETSDKDLPETIEDAVKFGRSPKTETDTKVEKKLKTVTA